MMSIRRRIEALEQRLDEAKSNREQAALLTFENRLRKIGGMPAATKATSQSVARIWMLANLTLTKPLDELEIAGDND